jgi:hypothetical protein
VRRMRLVISGARPVESAIRAVRSGVPERMKEFRPGRRHAIVRMSQQGRACKNQRLLVRLLF